MRTFALALLLTVITAGAAVIVYEVTSDPFLFPPGGGIGALSDATE